MCQYKSKFLSIWSFLLHNLTPVFDVDPRTEGASVYATTKEVVEVAIVRLGNRDVVDGGGGGEGAEGANR